MGKYYPLIAVLGEFKSLNKAESALNAPLDAEVNLPSISLMRSNGR